MKSESTIPIYQLEGQKLNGLGSMILQFMQQEIAASEEKSKKARKLSCTMSMAVEGGISVTISFAGNRILVENGIALRPDMYMHASYLLMTDILCGKVNPVSEFFKGKIKLKAIPRRPIQALKVLGILKLDPNAEYGLTEEI
jgi:putative sterol carrier protein